MIAIRYLLAAFAIMVGGCENSEVINSASNFKNTSQTHKAVQRQNTVKASTTSGTAPLTVVFEAVGDGRSHFGGVWLMFGDGESAMACRPGSACRQISITHVYTKTGEFVAVLKAQGEGQDNLMGQVKIKVTEN